MIPWPYAQSAYIFTQLDSFLSCWVLLINRKVKIEGLLVSTAMNDCQLLRRLLYWFPYHPHSSSCRRNEKEIIGTIEFFLHHLISHDWLGFSRHLRLACQVFQGQTDQVASNAQCFRETRPQRCGWFSPNTEFWKSRRHFSSSRSVSNTPLLEVLAASARGYTFILMINVAINFAKEESISSDSDDDNDSIHCVTTYWIAQYCSERM